MRGSYQAALDQASANLDETRDHLKDLGQQVKAAQAALDQTASQIKQADSAVTSSEAQLVKADADFQRASKLVKKGDISKRQHGYFRETLVGKIHAGDQSVVTLMRYPKTPLTGVVDSIGWGIAQQDGSTGEDLLPSISPTFEWIRLAQRVPVRVHLEDVPEAVKLRVGTTASVQVMTGTSDGNGKTAVAPAPAALQ